MDIETKTEDAVSPAAAKLSPNAAVLFAKFVAWIGVSTGALTVLCTVFGYIVEHAWLDRLGVPRNAYDSGSTEYVISGAAFLVSIIPWAVSGAPEFAIDYWWMGLAVIVFGVCAWRFHWQGGVRLTGATVLFAIWLAVILMRFEKDGTRADPVGYSIFVFAALVALLYCCQEAYAGGGAVRGGMLRDPRLPMMALVFCSVFSLPYLKGIHGTDRDLKTIEFAGKDRESFCALAPQEQDPSCARWQLIELGKDRTLLRKGAGQPILVVPSSAVTTFRIQQESGDK